MIFIWSLFGCVNVLVGIWQAKRTSVLTSYLSIWRFKYGFGMKVMLNRALVVSPFLSVPVSLMYRNLYYPTCTSPVMILSVLSHIVHWSRPVPSPLVRT